MVHRLPQAAGSKRNKHNRICCFSNCRQEQGLNMLVRLVWHRKHSGFWQNISCDIYNQCGIKYNLELADSVLGIVRYQSFGTGTTSPSGTNVWEDPGSLSIFATTSLVDYEFSSWSADTGSITFELPSASSAIATINGPGTITANFASATNSYTNTCSYA